MTVYDKDCEDFIKKFVKDMVPSEDNNFKCYMNNEFWTVSEFAALAAGLDPDTYTKGEAKELSIKEFLKRMKHAAWIHGKILDDIQGEIGLWAQYVVDDLEQLYMLRWRYIRWCAESAVIVHELFLDRLSPELVQLYKEFGLTNTTLRTANRGSQDGVAPIKPVH